MKPEQELVPTVSGMQVEAGKNQEREQGKDDPLRGIKVSYLPKMS